MARHLFVCTNTRGAGKPACGHGGGVQLLAAVQRLLVERRAPGDVLVTSCGCLGPCFDGPNAVIYPDPPDGAWFAGLTVDDAEGLVDHLLTGVPLTARRARRPGSLDDSAVDLPDPGSADGAPGPGSADQ